MDSLPYPPPSTEMWGRGQNGATEAICDSKVALELEAMPSRVTKQKAVAQHYEEPPSQDELKKIINI